MKADRLIHEFASRAITPAADGGDPLLLRPPDALELVNRAADEGVPIVGVVTFDAEVGGTTPPPVADRADFSSAVAEGHGCWEMAEDYIRRRGDRGMAFELTLGGDPIEIV